jgi:hypothetical protein
MTRCIFCGQMIHENKSHDEFYCENPDCEIYNQSWTQNELKDHQDWNVRHTRALEQRVQTLEQQLKEILEAIADAQKT